MQSSFVDAAFARKEYQNWTPSSSALAHVLAVAAGEKPLAAVNADPSAYQSELYDAQDLADFAKSKGCKVVFHASPGIYSLIRSGETQSTGLHLQKELCVYRDEEDFAKYKLLRQKRTLNTIDTKEYHEQLGAVLGYKPEDIRHFIDRANQSYSHDDVIGYINRVTLHETPALYDQLAKDPILSDLLPPRNVVSREM